MAVVGGIWLSTVTRDLPYIHHADEPRNLRTAEAMVVNGDPNPHFFNYPSLFLYLHAGVNLEGPLLGWMGGQETAPVAQVMGTNRSDTPGSVVLHRAVSVLLGVLTLVGVHATARRLTGRSVDGVVAVIALATTIALTTYARLITPDVLALAIVTAVSWAGVRAWRSPTWASYLLAGGLVGLATSAKYNAAFSAATLVIATLLATSSGVDLRRRVLRLGGAGLAAIVAFLATTPYSLLDRTAFLRDLRFERAHYATGHPGMEGGAARWYAEYLVTTETLLVAVAAIGVVAALWAGRWRAVALIGVFPVMYGAFAASQVVRNERTILLVLPSLAVLAGFGCSALRDSVDTGRIRTVGARVGTAAVVALLLLVGAGQLSRVVTALGFGPSTWEESREWVEDNIPAGSSIHTESYAPWIDTNRYEVTTTRTLAADPGVFDSGVSYAIASERMYGRYLDDPSRYPDQANAYRSLFESADTLAVFEGNGPTIRVLAAR